MLQLKIPLLRLFNEKTEEFLTIKPFQLHLEHSLFAIKEWEAITHKPFFKDGKTNEDLALYIKCMTLNIEEVPEEFFDINVIPKFVLYSVNNYINNPRTATTFKEEKRGIRKGSFVTSELLYYQMISAGIPMEFQYRHINELKTLLRVFSEKSKTPRKMTREEERAQRQALNRSRRAKTGSKG